MSANTFRKERKKHEKECNHRNEKWKSLDNVTIYSADEKIEVEEEGSRVSETPWNCGGRNTT